jgi:hypothetical protein
MKHSSIKKERPSAKKSEQKGFSPFKSSTSKMSPIKKRKDSSPTR